MVDGRESGEREREKKKRLGGPRSEVTPSLSLLKMD
jgi:hypothetical protein